MKKALFLAAFLALGTQLQAQRTSYATSSNVSSTDQTNSKALGVNLLFGGYGNNFGIGAKYQHFVTNNVRLEGSFGYYFPNKGLYAWDINANAHYVFRVAPKLALYPLAGFSFTNWGVKLGDLYGTSVYNHTGSIGANFGGGLQYFLSDNVFFNAEVREQVLSGNYSQVNLSLGLVARF